MPSIDDEPTLAELERFFIATAAASDPAALMDAATLKFRGMEVLFRAGDHNGVAKAGASIADDCLRLCVVPAGSEDLAGDKARFLAIMSRWAWPRRPALAAVMDAVIRAECRTWGEQIRR